MTNNQFIENKIYTPHNFNYKKKFIQIMIKRKNIESEKTENISYYI